jgi:hypothetical protein
VKRTPEPAQLLDVQVQQFARRSVFIALGSRPGLQFGQPVQAHALEQSANRAGRHLQLGGDLPAGPSRLPAFDELLDHRHGRGMRAGMRPRGAIEQACRTLGAKAGQPLVGRTHADAGGLCSLLDPQAFIDHAADEERSTAWGQTGMVMQVRPGLQEEWLIRTSSPPGPPRMNNLVRDHS